MWLVTSVVDKPFSFLCFRTCWVCVGVGGGWLNKLYAWHSMVFTIPPCHQTCLPDKEENWYFGTKFRCYLTFTH